MHPNFLHTLQAVVLGCGALALQSAYATTPIEKLVLTVDKVEFSYVPTGSGRAPFAIDITIQADGSVVGALPGLHRGGNVTLKRGLIDQTGPGVGALVDFDIVRQSPQFEQLGQLSMRAVDTRSLSYAVTDGRDSAQDADTLTFALDRSSAGSRIELTFQGAHGAQLSGQPAALFRPSGTGKTLTAVLLGSSTNSQDLRVTLDVRDQTGASVQIPVHIKRGY